MGREIRLVAKDWDHPKDHRGRYIPLLECDHKYHKIEDVLKEPYRYMPVWSDEEKTHMMMYEDTSEGTPISPAFPKDKPEELAKWLTDNKASSFGTSKATYQQWLGMIKSGGHAPSAVITSKGIISGVEAMAQKELK